VSVAATEGLMSVRIEQTQQDRLPAYATIPSASRVESVYRVDPRDGGLGELSMTEERVEPYV